MIELIMICIKISTTHMSYKEWNYKSIRVDTICNIITIVLICYILHIRKGNIYFMSVYENCTKFKYFPLIQVHEHKKCSIEISFF